MKNRFLTIEQITIGFEVSPFDISSIFTRWVIILEFIEGAFVLEAGGLDGGAEGQE